MNRLIGRVIVLFAALAGVVALASHISVVSDQTAETIWPNGPAIFDYSGSSSDVFVVQI